MPLIRVHADRREWYFNDDAVLRDGEPLNITTHGKLMSSGDIVIDNVSVTAPPRRHFSATFEWHRHDATPTIVEELFEKARSNEWFVLEWPEEHTMEYRVNSVSAPLDSQSSACSATFTMEVRPL